MTGGRTYFLLSEGSVTFDHKLQYQGATSSASRGSLFHRIDFYFEYQAQCKVIVPPVCRAVDLRASVTTISYVWWASKKDAIRPSHTLRCSTPAIGRSKAPAIHQNRMRCAAMHFPTCWNSCSRFWNISAIYYPIFKRFSAL